ELNPTWLLIGKGEMEVEEMNHSVKVLSLKTDTAVEHQKIPLYDLEASAGFVSLFQNFSTTVPIDYISIPKAPKCDGAIYVTGDSMYPLLKSGDMVVYKRIQNSIDNIFWGEMYIVSLDLDGDDFTSVKWVQKSD